MLFLANLKSAGLDDIKSGEVKRWFRVTPDRGGTKALRRLGLVLDEVLSRR